MPSANERKKAMLEINGKGIFNSLAMGKLYFYKRSDHKVTMSKIDNIQEEILRFRSALTEARHELSNLYQLASIEADESSAEIFQIHRLMLDDEDFYGAIESAIRNKSQNAEYAVWETSAQFAKLFEDMDDEYMKARSADVRDISKKLINILSGESNNKINLTEPVIIVADDLSPSETVSLDKSKILGFVTFNGSKTSHTAILAKTMNIPAIINTGEIDECHDGRCAILDASSGTLYIQPDDDKITDFKQRKKLEEEQNALLSALVGKPTETKSGRKVLLYANIGNTHDIPSVIQNDAEGIGLFRSEFIYLGKNTFPTEEEQFSEYKEVLEKMPDKRVVIRTMDIGADKKIDYFNFPAEENPALGYRAIRICLSEREIFKTQLRALFRASVFGRLAIMFPLIISVEEIRSVKNIIDEIKKDLRREGLAFSEDVELGIMIETPAAALISSVLAPEVDFFSIGTNDLTQYTLAIDRQNSRLDSFYNPHHPALFSLIEMTVENAHKNGKWVGICGDLAADTEMTEKFIRMGIDELSVPPPQVLTLRNKIRSLE